MSDSKNPFAGPTRVVNDQDDLVTGKRKHGQAHVVRREPSEKPKAQVTTQKQKRSARRSIQGAHIIRRDAKEKQKAENPPAAEDSESAVTPSLSRITSPMGKGAKSGPQGSGGFPGPFADEFTVEDGNQRNKISELASALERPNSLIDSAAQASEEEAGFLVVHSGNDAGRRIQLPEGRTTIGRSLDCDLVLTDVAVSRKHAYVERRDNIYVVCDLRSGNGTFVNERDRSDEVLIVNGDRFRIGNTTLLLDAVASEEEKTTNWAAEPRGKHGKARDHEDEISTVAGKARVKQRRPMEVEYEEPTNVLSSVSSVELSEDLAEVASFDAGETLRRGKGKKSADADALTVPRLGKSRESEDTELPTQRRDSRAEPLPRPPTAAPSEVLPRPGSASAAPPIPRARSVEMAAMEALNSIVETPPPELSSEAGSVLPDVSIPPFLQKSAPSGAAKSPPSKPPPFGKPIPRTATENLPVPDDDIDILSPAPVMSAPPLPKAVPPRPKPPSNMGIVSAMGAMRPSGAAPSVPNSPGQAPVQRQLFGTPSASPSAGPQAGSPQAGGFGRNPSPSAPPRPSGPMPTGPMPTGPMPTGPMPTGPMPTGPMNSPYAGSPAFGGQSGPVFSPGQPHPSVSGPQAFGPSFGHPGKRKKRRSKALIFLTLTALLLVAGGIVAAVVGNSDRKRKVVGAKDASEAPSTQRVEGLIAGNTVLPISTWGNDESFLHRLPEPKTEDDPKEDDPKTEDDPKEDDPKTEDDPKEDAAQARIRERREREAREKEAKEAKERERQERLAREKEAKEREREERLAREKERQERIARENRDDDDDDDDDSSSSSNSKINVTAVTRDAKALYARKEYGEAAAMLEKASDSVTGKASERLLDLADAYRQVGNLIAGAQQDQRNQQFISALEQYKRALSKDRRLGGSSHADLIRLRIGQVAPKAAFSLMGQSRYIEAKAAADEASRYKQRAQVEGVYRSLERKAEGLLEEADRALDRDRVDRAEELLEKIVKMAPKDSPVARKAKDRLRDL